MVRPPLPPNGYLQVNHPVVPPPENALSFLAIDTETTGTDFHKPYPGFKYAAMPFCISMCEYDGIRQALTPHCFFGTVDPATRKVDWPTHTLERVTKILLRYRPPHATRRKRNGNIAPRPYVFHNAPFDLRALGTLNIEIPPELCEDTLPAFHILDSGESHGLKDIGVKYLNILDTDELLLKEMTKTALLYARQHGIPVCGESVADRWIIHQYLQHPAVRDYAIGDVRRTVLAWLLAQRILTRRKLWPHYIRERRIMQDVFRMTSHPVHLRQEAVNLRDRYREKADQLRTLCADACGNPDINLNSPKQLGEVLYNTFDLPVVRLTATQQPSTDKFALADLHRYTLHERLEEPRVFIESLLDYRGFDKASTAVAGYIDRALEVGGRWWLWPSFKPWATRSTRFASGGEGANDYNQQNVAGNDEDTQTREAFGPPPGWQWLSIDFNQLELRLMAHASQDTTLHHILQTSGDAYVVLQDTLNAARRRLSLPEIPGKPGRKWAKVIWLAWQYGLGVNKFSRMAGLPAEHLMETMRQRYPGVVRFMHECSNIVRRQGFVCTLFGYPLTIRPEFNPYTGESELPHYKGTNYVIQGTAGDILKNSMIAANEYIDFYGLSDRIHLLMCIHDELLFEARRNLARKHIQGLVRVIASAGEPIGCPTPAKVARISRHWFETEDLGITAC